jgi:hypothetical protein
VPQKPSPDPLVGKTVAHYTLYLQCDAVADLRRLTEIAQRDDDPGATEESVARRLDPLCAAGLMLRDGRRYLALAVALGTHAPTSKAARSLTATLASGSVHKRDVLVWFAKSSRSFNERSVYG